MNQAALTYRYDDNPSRGLAATGAFFGLKFLLAIPHLIIVGVLQYLAFVVAYIGYFIVAFTGTMPEGIRTFVTMYLRWNTRAYGWVIGYTDVYPPFETDPQGYAVEAVMPDNAEPSKGWAVAGIFGIKFLAAIPHFIVVGVIGMVALVAGWIGYLAVLFTGEYPRGIGDFIAGVMQWWLRVSAWLFGLTDEYPPFALDASPEN